MSKVVTKELETGYEYEGMKAARQALQNFVDANKREKGFKELQYSFYRDNKGKFMFYLKYQVEE